MTPKQLMLAAIEHRTVERLPAATYNFHPLRSFSQETAYQPMLDALSNAEGVGILCKCSARRQQGERDERTTVERQDLGDKSVTTTRIETPKGPLQQIFQTPLGQPGYRMEPFIKDDADVARLLSLPSEPAQTDLSPAREFHDELGELGLAYVSYSDPFYSVAHWFDFEDFVMRCVVDLSVIQELVEREFERIKSELRTTLAQSRGCEFLFYTGGPEVATPPMMAPKYFELLVTPYQKSLVAMIKAAGQHASIHCHGRVKEVFDQILEIGPDALEPLEPPPQGDIGLTEALSRAEGRLCLMGYIQDQDFYLSAPGEMTGKVEDIAEIVNGRTGYIMNPTATPFMHPPPEQFVRNYVEFLEAAGRGGQDVSSI
ncbi:MAG: uroporphyrinogen decarboxylase family protein [Planctomycetota bacterium]|jgi:hypothetical protein|nr:uroporphyrinogen decarboxylase family protein [Planctomycetota bacterium]